MCCAHAQRGHGIPHIDCARSVRIILDRIRAQRDIQTRTIGLENLHMVPHMARVGVGHPAGPRPGVGAGGEACETLPVEVRRDGMRSDFEKRAGRRRADKVHGHASVAQHGVGALARVEPETGPRQQRQLLHARRRVCVAGHVCLDALRLAAGPVVSHQKQLVDVHAVAGQCIRVDGRHDPLRASAARDRIRIRGAQFGAPSRAGIPGPHRVARGKHVRGVGQVGIDLGGVGGGGGNEHGKCLGNAALAEALVHDDVAGIDGEQDRTAPEHKPARENGSGGCRARGLRRERKGGRGATGQGRPLVV